MDIKEILQVIPSNKDKLLEWLGEHGLTVRDALRDTIYLPEDKSIEVMSLFVNTEIIQAPTWDWALDRLGWPFICRIISAIEINKIKSSFEIEVGRPFLEEMILRGFMDSAKIILSKGFSLNILPRNERNMLHRLAEAGNSKGLAILQDINDLHILLLDPDEYGMTPIDVAVNFENIKFVEFAEKILDERR